MADQQDQQYKLQDHFLHSIVDDLVDNLPNLSGDRREVEKASSRKEFARIAAGISEDRYSAGSRAAQMTIIIFLKFGVEAALNFAKDVEHYER